VKYHIYRYGNGCTWMDDLQEAAQYFLSLPTDGRYTSIGISESYCAVDVIIKGEYTQGQPFLISQDIKQSTLFKEDPLRIINELQRLYQAVGIGEDRCNQMIGDLTKHVKGSEYDPDYDQDIDLEEE